MTGKHFTLLPAAALLAAGMATTADATPLVYEGFAYDDTGTVDGASGGTGFAGNWAGLNTAADVDSAGLTWGTLPVSGNYATVTGGSGSSSRNIGSTLSDAGLMANGQTVWFSVLLDFTGTNRSNANLNFALGSDGFHEYVAGPGGTFGERLNLETGEGIGFALTTRSSTAKDVESAYWQNTDADDNAEQIIQNTDITDLINRWSGDRLLIVGRIDWGADDLANESITLYAPDTNLVLGAGKTWSSIAALDQSAFDTVAFSMAGGADIDEIRFGATSGDVLVPEPGSLALLGLGGLAFARRRRS